MSFIWLLLENQNTSVLSSLIQDARDAGSILGSGRFPWRRKWQPTSVSLPSESHGQRSLMGYSPRGRKESDTTERLNSNTPEWGHNFLLLCRPCSTVLKTASFKR